MALKLPFGPPHPFQVSDAASTELRSANYLFGSAVQQTRGIKVAKDESKRVGLASATPAQAEQGKKVVKLMKAVALPKVIKDGWRAGLANSLVRSCIPCWLCLIIFLPGACVTFFLRERALRVCGDAKRRLETNTARLGSRMCF